MNPAWYIQFYTILNTKDNMSKIDALVEVNCFLKHQAAVSPRVIHVIHFFSCMDYLPKGTPIKSISNTVLYCFVLNIHEISTLVKLNIKRVAQSFNLGRLRSM